MTEIKFAQSHTTSCPLAKLVGRGFEKRLQYNIGLLAGDTSTDDTLGYDYAIIAIAADSEGVLLCKLEFHSNGAWVDDTGPGC